MTLDLSHLRVMLVNDDGIDAPGMALLERLVSPLIPDLWVVAPNSERSGTSRQVSLRREVEVEQRGDKRFAVDGTPTDCALIGLEHIIKDRKPDLVLSGINAGGNLGEDIGYSGTCGAAFEARQLGVPSIALSQGRATISRDGIWSASEALLPSILPDLVSFALKGCAMLNVNFPAVEAPGVQGVRVAHQGEREESAQLEEHNRHDHKRSFYFSFMRSDVPKDEGSDIDAVRNGYVSVTPITPDVTDYRALSRLTVALNLHR